MPESESHSEKGKGNAEGAENPGNAKKKPEADALQKMMKERFGDAKFGTLMNSIVDEMFKNMGTVDSTPKGPYTPDAPGAPQAQTEKTAMPVKPVNPAPPAEASEDADYAVKPSPDKPGPG